MQGTYNGLVRRSFYPQIFFGGALSAGMSGGPALDELWLTLREVQGRPVDVSRRAPSPVVRQLRALELIHWNDAAERTQAEVVGLLDRAADRLAREASSVNPVDAAVVG